MSVPFTKAGAAAPHGDAHTHTHEHTHGANPHGHTHEVMDHPGKFHERELPNYAHRNWNERAFTVGIGGWVVVLLTQSCGFGKNCATSGAVPRFAR